jgi:hypothetical protein
MGAGRVTVNQTTQSVFENSVCSREPARGSVGFALLSRCREQARDYNCRQSCPRTPIGVSNIALSLLLVLAAGCAHRGTTGPKSSGGVEFPSVVRYHCAGFGAAKAGDYLTAPATMDEFFASGTNSAPGATGPFDAPLATVFHRGRKFDLVTPTKPWEPYALLVVEKGRIRMTIPDGACKLSFATYPPVEPAGQSSPTARREQVLRLRETGTDAEVPMLTSLLASNLPPSPIYPYAAAQALFCIGTPAAHAALSNHLLRASFPVGLSVENTARWKMPEPQRSRFIEQYHLVNLDRDLLVRVGIEPPGKDLNRFVFTVSVQNVTEKQLRVPEQPAYLGELLYWRDATGRHAERTRTGRDRFYAPGLLRLEPRQTHTYRIEARLTKTDPLTLETEDVRFELGRPGAFHVWAVVEPPPTHQMPAHTWEGRAVSPGIMVDLPRSPLAGRVGQRSWHSNNQIEAKETNR